MIKSSDIMKLLKDKNADLSKEELEKIIENELQKDENEMDADLIEMCLDALKEKEAAPKKKNFPYVKVAAFVAAAAVLTFVITAVIPRLTDSNFNNKHITSTTTSSTKKETTTVTEITTENKTEKTSVTETPSSHDTLTEKRPAPSLKGETTKVPSIIKNTSTVSPEESFKSVLNKLLTNHGFDKVSLPQAIFENAEVTNRNFTESKAEIEIKSKGKIYNITIEKSSEKIEETNTIDVNGLNVSVKSENNLSEIKYRKNNLNYRIVFDSDYNEAVRIAKTIC